jgi:hypothetical protein
VNELIFFFKLFVESRKGGQTEFENHLTKSWLFKKKKTMIFFF